MAKLGTLLYQNKNYKQYTWQGGKPQFCKEDLYQDE